MEYIDHFAKEPENYLKYRPEYPDLLFDYLSSLVASHDLAWDCGTGNGQAALALSTRFLKVIASDINQTQMNVAPKRNNIEYQNWHAEKTELLSQSVDLITVAQALHWFDLENFYQEVKRVAKSNGMIAAWCYSLGKITPEIDQFISKLYYDILGNTYWPKERIYIDEEYSTIPFPFSKLSTPSFSIKKEYNLTEVLGYLNTWSAVKEYQKRNQKNPIDFIQDDLAKTWGHPEHRRVFTWPLHLLVGEIHKK